MAIRTDVKISKGKGHDSLVGYQLYIFLDLSEYGNHSSAIKQHFKLSSYNTGWLKDF